MVNYCLVLPILPGGIKLSKKFEKENGHGMEHDEFYSIANITREQTRIQRSVPDSGFPDLEIISLETKNPSKTLRVYQI